MRKTIRFLVVAGLGAVLAGVFSAVALGEMKVRLKDGRVYTLPVERDDVDTITYGPRAKGSNSPAGQTRSTSRVLTVGPGKRYAKPSAAAKAARDGDVIEIQAGLYRGDVAIWRASNLVIRGVGGRPHLKANGRAAQRKAIWVIKGNNTTVENIEFSGCRVRDLNGAGIRQEGTNLTVRRSYFHDNEIGIITGRNPKSDILIEHSEFSRNTIDYDRYEREGRKVSRSVNPGHNIYIGGIRSFTLRYSYVHHAMIGHNVKSRARTNLILYNRLMDEVEGRSSYIIDLPNGGATYMIGNLIQQGRLTENSSIVNYGTAGKNPRQELYVVNNTFVNDRGGGFFIRSKSKGTTIIKNNIFSGTGIILTSVGFIRANLTIAPKTIRSRIEDLIPGLGPSESGGNFRASQAGFRDRAKFDFQLTVQSPAVNAGVDPGEAGGMSLVPKWEYRHPLGAVKRTRVGRIDIGAYEFGG